MLLKHRQKLAMWRLDPRCIWCGVKLTFAQSTLEHLIPRADGGTRGCDNLAIACPQCNSGRRHAPRVMAIRPVYFDRGLLRAECGRITFAMIDRVRVGGGD